MATIPLKEVDKVEFLTILDNTIDLLMASTEQAKRFSLMPDVFTREVLLAEHGFAALVTVTRGNTSDSLLFDAGLSKNGLMHNMDVLEVRPNELHIDRVEPRPRGPHQRTDGNGRALGRAAKCRCYYIRMHFSSGSSFCRMAMRCVFPRSNRNVLSHEGIEFIEERGASYLLGGLVAVTGQIDRSTSFETGFPIHYARVEGRWQQDPLIHDDQALVLHVKDKGLVVLTGCGHAGVINTIRHAQQADRSPEAVCRDRRIPSHRSALSSGSSRRRWLPSKNSARQ